jgi:hypothetical protein
MERPDVFGINTQKAALQQFALFLVVVIVVKKR